MHFQKKLGGLLAAATFAAVSPAQAEFGDFLVDETPYGGDVIEADKLNGGYEERITFTATGNPDVQTFVTTAFADFGQYFRLEGTEEVSDSVLNDTYDLYAIFTSAGNVNTSGPQPVFTGTSGSFDLYLDPNDDTDSTLGATGADPVTLSNDGDDFLIADANNLTQGFGILVPGIGGFFDLTFNDFTLTIAGQSYYIEPDPFYLKTVVDGDFDNFTIAGTQTLTGDVSAVFIPEPGTLALMGAAFAGIGFSARRKAKAS